MALICYGPAACRRQRDRFESFRSGNGQCVWVGRGDPVALVQAASTDQNRIGERDRDASCGGSDVAVAMGGHRCAP